MIGGSNIQVPKKKPPVRQAAPRASVSLVEASLCLDPYPTSSLSRDSPSFGQLTQLPFPLCRVAATLGPPSSGGFDGDQRLLHRLTEFQILSALHRSGVPLDESRFANRMKG